MSPIPLGILAASGLAAFGTDFDLLETQVLDLAESNVTFSSLAATYGSIYQHLQVRISGRFLGAFTERTAHLRFNSITSGDYQRHALVGTGSTVVSSGAANSTSIAIGSTPANNATGSVFTACVIDILDPFETTKFTTVNSLSGNISDYNELNFNTGAYRNTAAINSVEFFDLSSNQNWAVGSRFSIYGIKAA
jgi:hypothetical protein